MYQVEWSSVYNLPFIMLCSAGWLQATKLNVFYTGSFFQVEIVYKVHLP